MSASPAEPRTMLALTTRLLRSPIVSRIPIPKPSSTELLIKVKAVALNPTDWRFLRFSTGGYVIGCDVAGEVISSPSTSSFKPGDRVASVVHGCNSKTNGAFAEWAVVDSELAWSIPEGTSYEAAAGMGVTICTAALTLEQKLLPWAAEKGLSETAPLLVYSAASAVGLQCVQLARYLSPTRPIIALCSPPSHDLLLSFGATHCLAYNDPDLRAKIKALPVPPIQLVIDAYSEGNSTDTCQDFMSSDGGRIVRMKPPSGKARNGIEVDWVFAYTVLNKPIRMFVFTFPPRPEDHLLAHNRMTSLTKLLQDGSLRTLPTRRLGTSLDKVLDGFAEMKDGRVRGEKLVVTLE